MRLLTGVAESMRTLVFTPALMMSRIKREYRVIPSFRGRVVSEIVGLINHDKIVVPPIDGF